MIVDSYKDIEYLAPPKQKAEFKYINGEAFQVIDIPEPEPYKPPAVREEIPFP